MLTTYLAASSFIISCSIAPVSTGVDLAQLDGWDIVLAPDAIASEVYAAEEFRDPVSYTHLTLPTILRV